MKVRTLMSSPAQTCRPDTDLGAVSTVMWDHDCGFVPVVNSAGAIVGVITDRDICIAAATRGLRPQELTAEHAMSRVVHSCAAKDSVTDALATMREFTVRRLPVVDDDGQLQGVISMNDIVLASNQKRKPAASDIVSVTAAICSHRRTATATTEQLRRSTWKQDVEFGTSSCEGVPMNHERAVSVASAATAAHELRNFLAVIRLSATRLLRDDGAERRTIENDVQRLLRSVHRAERVVEDLSHAAAEEQHAFDVHPEHISTTLLLKEAKDTGEVLASDAAVTLEVEVGADLPAVQADAGRIGHVFHNLVANATKYTPPGGRITIRAFVRGNEVHFSVADTGNGLSEDGHSRVFTRHWQAEPDVRRGRGLGLWICREIVEAHGGRAWIERSGSGTTVMFSLPRC